MTSLPGVYYSDVFPQPAPVFRTGVPAFLGAAGDLAAPVRLERGDLHGLPAGALAAAVAGFFDNGGDVCHVVPVAGRDASAVEPALSMLDAIDEVDLVCAPELMTAGSPALHGFDLDAVARTQRAMLRHCADRGDRFAILDAVPSAPELVRVQRSMLDGAAAGFGALYHPWLRVSTAADAASRSISVGPCGHVAGVYARSDRSVGPHKAPANEPVDGILGLRAEPTDAEVGTLYRAGVNCLRPVPARGIRVWGARTMHDGDEWRDVGTRRTVTTLTRWLERFLRGLAFEPNDLDLWLRITREIGEYLEGLFALGALHGRTAAEAFSVRCDGETNTRETVAAGLVVTHIGMAINRPAEFIHIRVHHGAGGVAVQAA